MPVRLSLARLRLGAYIERVNTDHDVVEIKSGKGAAVLIARSEYEEIVDTLFRLSDDPDVRDLIEGHRSRREAP
ncbi:type II toxin-antitoxin system prevent-host-death family antitoxin [Prescottella defluvii]|nr:type II toxin-antitoxin system prevent-host-death family antitoxin [Prescottella defluvii]